MPRTPITTTFTERTPPSTSWDINRTPPSTEFDTPRYSNYLEDLSGTNMDDLDGIEVLTITGYEVNKLDTEWN